MMDAEPTVPLPEGVTVTYDWCIGYTFWVDGFPLVQHPKDDDAIRRLIHGEIKRREQERAGFVACA